MLSVDFCDINWSSC